MKNKYSIFSLIKNAFSNHENWQRAWRDPEPKKEYDAVIVGGGGHGLATAYYLAKKHNLRNIAVSEEGVPFLFKAGVLENPEKWFGSFWQPDNITQSGRLFNKVMGITLLSILEPGIATSIFTVAFEISSVGLVQKAV